MLAHLRRVSRLARHLGPWADELQRPLGIRRSELRFQRDGQSLRGWLYRPSVVPEGAILVVPGLHYLGPADPRLDRFCRVLSASGQLVFCPFLPEFEALRVGAALGPDTIAAFDAFDAHTEQRFRPGVFSISFGSRPALELAAARADRVGGLLLFGGFADWNETMRFSMQGAPGRPYDPLNRPVVFNNLLPFFEGIDERRVGGAIMRQVRATWGRPAMKVERAFETPALEVARELEGADRELFLQAVGLEAGGDERALEALARAGSRFAHLDPQVDAAQVRAPTLIAHGREDDVIPFEHAERLASMIPNARALVTGSYAHTGQAGLLASVRKLFDGASGEAQAMTGILDAMARIGCNGMTSGSY